MRRVYYTEEVRIVHSNNYGCFSFIFDCLMTIITGGLWLIWVFVREMRNR